MKICYTYITIVIDEFCMNADEVYNDFFDALYKTELYDNCYQVLVL